MAAELETVSTRLASASQDSVTHDTQHHRDVMVPLCSFVSEAPATRRFEH